MGVKLNRKDGKNYFDNLNFASISTFFFDKCKAYFLNERVRSVSNIILIERDKSMLKNKKTPQKKKICHIYLILIKLDTVATVIPYLKKIQKIYKSRDTSLEFC